MISVIIITFNQEEFLRRHLSNWLEQDLLKSEVIVVDMNSEDNTILLLEQQEEIYNNLRHISLPASARGISKDRLAIMLGMRMADNDRVIITTPRCYPTDNTWMAQVNATWNTQRPILLIPVWPDLRKPTCKQRWNRFLARHGHPRLLGPALGYNRQLFLQQNGFPSRLKPKQSALDTLVRTYAKKQNTQVCNLIMPYNGLKVK